MRNARRPPIQGGYGHAGFGENPNAAPIQGGYGHSGLGLGPGGTPSGAQIQHRIPPGALVQYYADLASGIVAPEDMRIESLEYKVQIDPLGNIVSVTQPTQIVARYNFAMRRVTGFIMDPDLAGAAPNLVSFNVLDQGRNFEVFKRPVNMQSLISRSGSGNIAEWDGTFIMVPGAQVEVSWKIDTSRWPVLVGATKELGIQLSGDYVVCQGFEGESR
jgi:hypothetical protein